MREKCKLFFIEFVFLSVQTLICVKMSKQDAKVHLHTYRISYDSLLSFILDKMSSQENIRPVQFSLSVCLRSHTQVRFVLKI